jgi:hypothetical protein
MIARLPLLAFVALLALPATDVTAQDAGYPVCEMSDSISTLAVDLNDILHRFGSDTQTYPHEFSDSLYYPVFHTVFEFWLSRGVSDRWSQSEFQTLITGILDNDSTVTDDVFGIDWDYFVRSGTDGNANHAGVRFTVGSDTCTTIKLRLYDKSDLLSPCSTGRVSFPVK